MAESNIEVVRRALADFDGASAEAMVEWTTEDVELRSAIIGGAEGIVYRGHDGLREWARGRDEAFDEIRFVVRELVEVGELVVALGHVHARGEASGLTLDTPSGWVVTVRDGRVASMYGYLDPDEALAAARAGEK